MFLEVVCGGVEDGKGSEGSMKGFAMKASLSEMVSLGQKGNERVGVKNFLAGGCRKKVLVIKEEVESEEGFGEAQQRCLVFGTRIQCGRGVRFEVEGVEVGVSGFMRKIIIHWHLSNY